MRRTLQPTLAGRTAPARARPILHGDETGWRETGQNGAIWACRRPGAAAVRYAAYDHSRGQVLVKRRLDGPFAGQRVSDFSAGYTGYAGQQQRCWVQLLRDLHAVNDDHPPDAAIPA